MKELLLHSQRCWIDGSLQAATIHIQNGAIQSVKIGPKGAYAEGLLDLGDAVLMPGVIDAHVHINEPGRTYWEGFDTATKAAAFGGISTVVDMPLNSTPVVTTVAALQEKLAHTTDKLHVNCGFWGGIVGNEAVEKGTHELKELLDAGCLGVKAFLIDSGLKEFPNATLAALDTAMPILAEKGVPLLVHCEWAMPLEGENDLANNPTSYATYLASRPKEWENEAIRQVLHLCQKHHCPTHIVHLSSAEALPFIRQAQEAGAPVTVETCPHYLYFDAESIPDGSTLHKCAPPIREANNNLLLKYAIRDGDIVILGSDHSPAPPALKALESGSFKEAWGGIAGLQFLLPVSWTALKEHLTLSQFIPLLTSTPASLIGLEKTKGKIAQGYDADLVVWQPEASFEVVEEMVHHRHKGSPYSGNTLFGQVTDTMIAGKWVVKGGEWLQGNCGAIVLAED